MATKLMSGNNKRDKRASAALGAVLGDAEEIEVVCPKCEQPTATRAHLATLRDDGQAHTYACPCGWRNDLCEVCAKPMPFDASKRGLTVGGLELVGWLGCCGIYRITKCGKVADQAGGTWTVAKSGRSLDAGGVRLRAEGAGAAAAALMERIARLPDLERELEELRAMRSRS